MFSEAGKRSPADYVTLSIADDVWHWYSKDRVLTSVAKPEDTRNVGLMQQFHIIPVDAC